METVFDGPVVADHRANHAGRQDQGGDVKARLRRDLAIDLALAFDHDEAFQSGPVVAFLQPLHIVDRRIDSRFDATVVAVDRFVSADRRVLETIGFLLGGENFHVFVQCSLIALEGDNVISPFIDEAKISPR